MQARIIDISDSHIYLEIDEQLRFRTQYVARSEVNRLSKHDRVNFDFDSGNGRPRVIIRNIVTSQEFPPFGGRASI